MAGELIALVAAIIAVGVLAQVLADRFRVPGIVFLLAAGIALGPEGVGFVTPESFGDALPAIVGLSVAIIVFEGAFHLRIERLREAPAATLRLVTVGAVISLLGTALAVRLALGMPWAVAFLVGSLLVATGPTVIAPILRVVPVRDRVSTLLETEGIVNDVTAAIAAVVVFEVVVVGEGAGGGTLVATFAEKLGVGVLVGLLVAVALWYGLRHVDLSPTNAPRNARLLVLAGALVAYAGADAITTEAGIAAAATAGVVLGNLDVPYEADITDFKGDVTLLVLSFVFIALAALLEFEDLLSLGLGGVAVVLAVALLIRPAIVFLSTTGGRFTRAEKLFVSFVGPRGIIPASVATLFAVQLSAAGLDRVATVLVGTVFLTILVTVVIEGSLARLLGASLDVIPMRTLIIGGGTVGRDLATRLEARAENVVIVDNDPAIVERARNAGHTVRIGDGTNIEDLRAAGVDNAATVVAATGDDDVNLLVAQLARSTFDTERVLARVNNPDNADAFRELGVETVSSTVATAWALDNRIERPALFDWMTELGRSGDVQEVEVTAEHLDGTPIAELGGAIPESCLVALVARDGETHVPDGEFELRCGDRLTLVGGNDAVETAFSRLHPE
jgi:NhaP-type Na+/H+ or K+/H+ antiporter